MRTPAPSQPLSLTTRAARGVKWTAYSTIIVSVLQFAQLAVLARILSPTDFGLMAMIQVVLSFGAGYADLGISAAIIYRQDVTRDQMSTLYWLNIMAGLCVFAAVCALSPAIADFYRQPRLSHLVCLAATIFVVKSFGQQFQMLFEKNLRFRLLALTDMSSAIVGAGAAIGCALGGLGVVSLIIGQLVNTSAGAATLVVMSWRTARPKLHFRWRDTRGYLSFGAYQMGERSVYSLSANLDFLIIGRVLGPALLGPYALAYQLAVVPMLKIGSVLTRVAFPVFALKQNDMEGLRRGYLRLSELLVFAVYPFLIGLIILAPLVIPILYGSQWQAVVPLVEVLGLMALFKTLASSAGSVMLGIGRAGVNFWSSFGVALVTAVSFLIAASSGDTLAVAWAWVFMGALALAISALLLRHLIGLTLRRYSRHLIRYLVVVALMGLIVAVAYWTLSPYVHRSVFLLAILVGLGVSAYLALWRVVDRSFIPDLVHTLVGPKAGAV